jgi:ABC-type glycerol-3-phosphate transport system substrate-binding protein
VLLATLVVAALLAASCSDAHTLEEKERAEGATDPRVVTVFQPPELIPALKALAEAFSSTHPDISFAFDDQPSKSQRTRIEQGATPALWIDQADVIDSYAEDRRAQAPLFDLGADVLQFVVRAVGSMRRVNDVPVVA